jgi:hypothetical protein
MRSIALLALILLIGSALSQHHIRDNIPNYPGLQFDADGKLSITVFSDLHFGERKSLPSSDTISVP